MLTRMMEWYDATDKERRIRDLALDVAREEIAPRAAKHDEEETFVRDSIEALAEAGLLGANIPEQYGGMGGTQLAAVMALEAVSGACGSTGASYLFHLNLANLIVRGGPEELRQRFLPGMAKDKLGAFAINEGVRLFKDPFHTVFEEQGDDLVLNGFKPFSTSAGEADVTVVQVQRAEAKNPFPVLNQEFILIERGTPGFSAQRLRPLGLRGASNGSIKLEDVRVPRENIVGEQPGSMIRAVVIKGQSTLGPNVVATGIAGAALEAAVERVMERGTPEEWQTHILGPMSGRLNALRGYNYFGARVMSGDAPPVARWAEAHHAHTEAQWLGGEDPPWICHRAMEVMGGGSFMLSSPVQRYYRDARASAYLAFSMDERRSTAGEMLYGDKLEKDQPPTMPWDGFTRQGFRMSNIAAMPLGPRVQAEVSREAVEEFARSRGADEVTIEVFLDYQDVLTERPAGFTP
jgi:butyryl-CoA dehydrogenase